MYTRALTHLSTHFYHTNKHTITLALVLLEIHHKRNKIWNISAEASLLHSLVYMSRGRGPILGIWIFLFFSPPKTSMKCMLLHLFILSFILSFIHSFRGVTTYSALLRGEICYWIMDAKQGRVFFLFKIQISFLFLPFILPVFPSTCDCYMIAQYQRCSSPYN